MILGCDVKNVIVCPKVWTLNSRDHTSDVGKVMIIQDSANLSTHSPGVGVNLSEYGARFYDCSQTYDKELTSRLHSLASSTDSATTLQGAVFWINNSSIPATDAFSLLAAGLSNERVSFSGLVKTSMAELLAVQHRKTKESRFKLRSAAIGVVTDAVVREQKETEGFKRGVHLALSAIIATLTQE